MKDEVRQAIKSMKSYKTTGPDGIFVEMIQSLDELGVDAITNLVNKIYDTGKILEDLTKSICIVILKNLELLNVNFIAQSVS